jgi:hypothetical protein
MRDHADAIEFLRAHGIEATRRVWALGDTVVVPLGPPSRDRHGMVVDPRLSWLVPRDEGSWDVLQLVGLCIRRRRFSALREACTEALHQYGLWERVGRCPDCRGDLLMAFGESFRPDQGGIVWWEGTRCRSCGAQAEADGRDRLPAELRTIELERNGRWGVSVSRAPTLSGWSAIRQALGLDLTRVSAMRRRVPGVVYDGTFAEAQRIATFFTAHGGTVELVDIPASREAD